MTDTKGNG